MNSRYSFFYLLLALLFTSEISRGQTESEPNNSLANANPMAFATPMSGNITCTPGDVEDFFRVVLPPGNKSIRLITTASTTTGTGSFYVYLYNKFGNQLDNRNLSLSTTAITDSLDIDCFEGDTFYVRIANWSGSTCKQYSLRCESTNAFTLKNDREVNDNFANAVPLAFGADSTGHLTSQRYINAAASTDQDDYYRCILPPGGKSIRLITSTRMVSPGKTGSVYYHIYNKFQGDLINRYIGLSNTAANDTLDFNCFEGDTLYVRVRHWTGDCKEYRLRVEYTNNFTLKNDTEPNDNLASAQGLDFRKDTTGHLSSQRYAGSAYSDQDDYYRCVLPPGGTKSLRLITATRTVTPGETGSVYYYLYNKYGTELVNRYVGLSNVLTIDTLDYNCFEGDTFFVRVHHWTGNCKEYRLRTDYTNNFVLQNDLEPNDNFATAVPLAFNADSTGHLTAQRYLGPSASTDLDDYYRVVLPPGGKSIRLTTSTRTVTPGEGGSVYYYLYNKYQGELINRYVALSNSLVNDTLDYNCFEGDTIYVRIRHWTGNCKEYRLKVNYTGNFTLKNDAELNDNIATAQGLAFGRDTTGHLNSQRYVGPSASADEDDYFRVVLPPGGKSLRLITATRTVAPGETGSVYYYLYNKYGTSLTNRYVGLSNTLTIDTLDYNCFEGDTIYVRVRQWTGSCKEYRLRVEHTGKFMFGSDTEPNDDLASATPIDFGQSVAGHLDAQLYGPAGARTDAADWYRCILPGNGKGVRIVAAMRTVEPGATGAMYYYIYNRAGGEIAQKYVAVSNAVKADTLEFNCIQPDTFYIRVRNWSGPCKEYTFTTTKSTTGPIAFDISHTRFGNDFSFMNTTRNAKTFRWTFGDGKTDTVAAPTHLYGIGKFYVTLNATNICGTKAFKDTIEVDGIEYYTPKSAGTNTGFGVFNVRVFGGGLDSQLVMTLKKDGKSYAPDRTRSPQSSEATSTFNFKNLPFGKYDVDIKLSSGQVYHYPQGFEVHVDTPGINIVTEIVSPARVRTGRMNTYAIKVRNKNGRLANGVRLFIVLPRDMKNDIHKILYKPKGKLIVKGEGFQKLTIDPDFYSNVYYGGKFDPNRDSIVVNHDKVYSVIDSSTIWYDVDSLFGERYVGRVYPINIPFIPANGTHTITFQAGTSANGNYQIATFVHPWTTRQNPVSGETLDYIHDAGMGAAAIAEVAPIPGLQQVGKAAGYIDIASQVVFAEGVDWWYGTNVADDEFYARQGTSLVGELAGELVPFGKNADEALDGANSARKRMARQTESLQLENDFVLAGLQKNHPQLAKNMSERIEYLQNAIKANQGIITRQEKEDFILRFGQWASKQGINLTVNQIESMLFPEDIKKKPVESLNSFDPNQIYGPTGAGRDQYIRRTDELAYEVTFENVDTALAPAQIVRVEVALDTNKYDISSVNLGSVRIGGKLYVIEEARKDFFRNIDLRPAKNMIVRVNAKTDTMKGTIYWEFLSLDPATMNLTQDVLDGFLPPNKTAPEGEGAVTFTARPRQTIANRDSLSAFATIYFDENDPILTNVWRNRIDEGKPVSKLDPAVQVSSDSLMTLALSGTDGESGFQEYRLYVRASGDTAWSKPHRLNDVTGSLLIGKVGETYQFYVEGRDSVGIWEKKSPAAEASVTLRKKGPAVPADAIAVYPNPATNSVNVRVNAAAGGALRINVLNISGQVVSMVDAQHAPGTSDYLLSTTALESGVYFVEVLVNDAELATAKLMILR